MNSQYKNLSYISLASVQMSSCLPKPSTILIPKSPISYPQMRKKKKKRSPQILQKLEYKGNTKEKQLAKMSLELNHMLERRTKPLNLYQLKCCHPNPFMGPKKKRKKEIKKDVLTLFDPKANLSPEYQDFTTASRSS